MRIFLFGILIALNCSLSFSANAYLSVQIQRDSISEEFYAQIEKGKLYKANQFIKDKIQISKEANNKLALGVLYNLKGEFEVLVNNYEEAHKSFILAENYCRDTNDNLNLGHVYKNIGNYHLLNSEYFIALNKFNHAITIYNRSNHKEFYPEIIVKKIETYLALKKYQRAEQILSKRMKFIADKGSDKTVTELYYLAARCNFELKNIDQAIENSLKCKHLNSSKKVSEVYLKNLKLLSDLFKEKSEFKLSNQYAQERQQILDSIYSSDYSINEKIISPKAIKDFNKAVNKDLLDKQKKLQEGNPFGENTSTIFIFMLLILLIPLVFLVYINNQRRKHNAVLENKNIELILANKKANEAIKSRDNFLSTVTHELRTPLYAVIGLTDILLDNNPQKNQINHLKSLKHAGDHLLSFINKILQLNKLKSSNIEINNSNFNLKNVVKNIVNTLDVSSNKNKNSLEINYQTELTENFYGDKIKISQIVLNLISNSLKFTKHGKIVITIFSIKESKSYHKIGIKVTDNGIGISEEKQNDVFKNFKQVNTNDEKTGTGLGLPIVKSLVKLLNGKVILSSKLEEGTSVTVEVPLEYPKTKISQITPNIKFSKSDLNRIKVLVVDDNNINQTITCKILENLGLNSDAVSDGRSAIESILNSHYDIVLMDINMPHMDGFETTERIRTFNSKITIIALTAISKDDDEIHFTKKGFDGFISKPFEKEEFKTIIHSKINAILKPKDPAQIL